MGVVAVTVAVRAALSTSATSPNELPGPSVATVSPLDRDRRLAALHNEEVEALDPFGGDRDSFVEMALDELGGQVVDGLVVELGEQGDAANEVCRRSRHGRTLQLRVGRVIWVGDQLLDAAFGSLEQRGTPTVELLSPLPEPDRLVDSDVAALEFPDDLLELTPQLLERLLAHLRVVAHGRTSATVAVSLPVASSMSRELP